jgi:hypothetical protein
MNNAAESDMGHMVPTRKKIIKWCHNESYTLGPDDFVHDQIEAG